jgi:hypothetical protein
LHLTAEWLFKAGIALQQALCLIIQCLFLYKPKTLDARLRGHDEQKHT